MTGGAVERLRLNSFFRDPICDYSLFGYAIEVIVANHVFYAYRTEVHRTLVQSIFMKNGMMSSLMQALRLSEYA